MATISVPITSELETVLNTLIGSGFADSRAEAFRRALREAAQERALQNLLLAQREIKEGKGLRGDLRAIVAAID